MKLVNDTRENCWGPEKKWLKKGFPKMLEKVNDISEENLLVTLDVKSLYSNIPNNEDIKTVKKSYEKYQKKAVSSKVIITF